MSSKRLQRAIMRKRRTTIYIDEDVWDQFMKYLVEKHGKTHGGLISQEIEKAIRLLTKR
jgi:hypothetical protein